MCLTFPIHGLYFVLQGGGCSLLLHATSVHLLDLKDYLNSGRVAAKCQNSHLTKLG